MRSTDESQKDETCMSRATVLVKYYVLEILSLVGGLSIKKLEKDQQKLILRNP